MRRLLAALGAAVLTAGCVHVLPRQVADDWRTCRETTIEDVEANLARSEFRIQKRSAGYVKSTWVMMNEDIRDQVHSVGMYSPEVRVIARQAGSDVRYDPFIKITMSTGVKEALVEDLTEEMMRDENSRDLFNMVRKAVCGGPEEYFVEPRGR